MTAREILLEAAEICRIRWHQGCILDSERALDGKHLVCALDALDEIPNQIFRQRAKAQEALREQIGIDGWKRNDSIISWNDYPGRTVDEIVGSMTRAAERLP